jgi:hypothetical protein
MKLLIAITVAGLAASACLDAGAAEIFRCSTPSGSIAYQQFPCAPNNDAGKVDVPSAYPDVDVAARDRLFQREAGVDQRLEAQRDRLSREEMTRMVARAQVAAAEAAAAITQPAGAIFITRATRYRHHPRMGSTSIR